MKEPRVINIIRNYEKGGLKKVEEYLNQSDFLIDPSTWTGKIKDLIENGYLETAKEMIELIGYKFLILNKDGKKNEY